MKENIDRIIRELGRRIGLSLSVYQGASVVTMKDGREIWIEAPSDSALVIVHCSLKEAVFGGSLTPVEMERILDLNAQPNIMKGAWIAAHADSNTLRLCSSAPKNFIDVETLEIIIDNVLALAKDVFKIIESGRKKTA